MQFLGDYNQVSFGDPRLLFWIAISYQLIAYHLSYGIPPLYRNFQHITDNEKQIARMFFFAIAVIFLMLFLTLKVVFLYIVSAISIWHGLTIRYLLRKLKGGPLPWIFEGRSQAFFKFFTRWPMLIFDVVTLIPAVTIFLVFSL